MNHLKIIKLSTIGIIFLIIYLLTSCSSEPKHPESFGVYYLSSDNYFEIEREKVWDRKQSLGKPTAGELGIRSMSKVFSDSRFGKDHTIRRYYVSMSEAPFINIDEFIKNGLIINGEAITNCELIKVPDKVKDIHDNYHDNYTGTIYYKIIDSWGELNYTANNQIPVDQKKIDENIYQIIPNNDIKIGIYLLSYKSHGQSLNNEFIPFYVVSSEHTEKMKSTKLLDSEKVKIFIKNSPHKYLSKNGFYYHVIKNGEGPLINTLKEVPAKYTISFLDSTAIYSDVCTLNININSTDTTIMSFIPYIEHIGFSRPNWLIYSRIVGQLNLGSHINLIIPSDMLKYSSLGYKRSDYKKGRSEYPIDIPPFKSLLLELTIEK